MNGIFDAHAAEYDRWFDENERLYQAEVEAVRRLLPPTGVAVEVGVGTGRFAVPLAIETGVEPARVMARIAKERGVAVSQAIGERLPFRDAAFDCVLLVTVLCFVQDVGEFLREARRIIKPGGKLVIGFIDRDSALGQLYESRKNTDPFYKVARFLSVPEIVTLIGEAGFADLRFAQTLLGLPDGGEAVCRVVEGYGEGAFVVVGATRRQAAA